MKGDGAIHTTVILHVLVQFFTFAIPLFTYTFSILTRSSPHEHLQTLLPCLL